MPGIPAKAPLKPGPVVSPPSPPKKRRRRSAVEARRAILDAARKRLAEGGPEAIRLQEIARDVGISHPAILHHFESRDGLMKALALSAVEAMDVELVNAIGSAAAKTAPVELLESVFTSLRDRGLARLLGWYALSHFTPAPHEEQFILRNLAEVLQSRLERIPGVERPTADEARQLIRLSATAMLGDAIFGDLLDVSLGAGDDPDPQARFRTWFAGILSERLGLDRIASSGAPEPDAPSASAGAASPAGEFGRPLAVMGRLAEKGAVEEGPAKPEL